MVLKEKIHGYENFIEFIGKLDTTGKVVNIYFTGTKDENGVSWCPDCVEAEPFVKTAIEKTGGPDSYFVEVHVGDRAFWKDPKCPFRTDKNIHISVIPTFIRWKGAERLEGEQLLNPDLLNMFLNDD